MRGGHISLHILAQDCLPHKAAEPQPGSPQEIVARSKESTFYLRIIPPAATG
jgi:hypothetical protein